MDLIEFLASRFDGECRGSPSAWLWAHPEAMRHGSLSHNPDLSALRWTVDTADDLACAEIMFRRLPEGFTMDDVLAEFGPRASFGPGEIVQAR